MDKIFQSVAAIRFSDCDPLGHLNNQRYMDYFLNAREDQLKKYLNFDIYEYAKLTGNIWVMFQNQITFIKPVYYNKDVLITSSMFRVTDKSIHVEMQMLNEDGTKLHAMVWMIAVHINMKNETSCPTPPDILETLMSRVEPIEQQDYQERVKFLQQKYFNKK
jgi:acyl-CoA thioester hydrolase